MQVANLTHKQFDTTKMVLIERTELRQKNVYTDMTVTVDQETWKRERQVADSTDIVGDSIRIIQTL